MSLSHRDAVFVVNTAETDCGQAVCLTEQAVCLTEQAVCLTEQAVCLTEQAVCLTEQAVCLTEQAVCLTEQAVCLTEQACCAFWLFCSLRQRRKESDSQTEMKLFLPMPSLLRPQCHDRSDSMLTVLKG